MRREILSNNDINMAFTGDIVIILLLIAIERSFEF